MRLNFGPPTALFKYLPSVHPEKKAIAAAKAAIAPVLSIFMSMLQDQ
jgi:hypothetical protein